LEVEIPARIGVPAPNLGAHLANGIAQFLGIAFAKQDLPTDLLEALAQFGVAGAEPGTRERLVFPDPGVLALVACEAVERNRQEPGIAVGAQAQVNFVQSA